jgi:UPF0755 protein
MSDAELMTALGEPGVAAEGRFYPDTYAYSKGASDLAVLKRAHHAMQKRLAAAWAERAADTPLKSADEALTLASIVEKETGVPADRGKVAAVFVNRLRHPSTLTCASACRRRRSRCRARHRCWRRCGPSRSRRCTSSRVATAAASSVKRWLRIIGR